MEMEMEIERVINRVMKCDYCDIVLICKDDDACPFLWRMSEEPHERIPGHEPNPEGRGIHRLCFECNKALESICTFSQSEDY